MAEEFHDIDRLNHLLEAEACGHHVDIREAQNLAHTVSRQFPFVAQTLARMVERHREGSDQRG